MLNLNYYFVDVGENYCSISERNCLISLREALLEKNSNQLKIVREFLTHAFKKNCMFSKEEEFKIVFVNKVGKIFIESYVEDTKTRVRTDPIVSSKKFDVYMMIPGQDLNVTCQVIKQETENRNIPYETIVLPRKNNTRKKKY